MFQKNSKNASSFTEDANKKNIINRQRNNATKSVPISILSHAVISKDPVELNERTRIQNSSAMFDPNNASPASEFMELLKLRMSIYFEHDMDIFINQS